MPRETQAASASATAREEARCPPVRWRRSEAGSWAFSNAQASKRSAPYLCELPWRSDVVARPSGGGGVTCCTAGGRLRCGFAPLALPPAPAWPSSRPWSQASTAANSGSFWPVSRRPGLDSSELVERYGACAKRFPRCRCGQSGQGAHGDGRARFRSRSVAPAAKAYLYGWRPNQLWSLARAGGTAERQEVIP